MSEGAPRLDGVEFGVLALGDTAYAEFCAIGRRSTSAGRVRRQARRRSRRLRSRFRRARGEVDRRRPEGTRAGGRRRGRVIEVDSASRRQPEPDVVEAEVTEQINLNSSRSDKETIHLALSFDGAAPAYKPATRSILRRERSGLCRRTAQAVGFGDEACAKK